MKRARSARRCASRHARQYGICHQRFSFSGRHAGPSLHVVPEFLGTAHRLPIRLLAPSLPGLGWSAISTVSSPSMWPVCAGSATASTDHRGTDEGGRRDRPIIISGGRPRMISSANFLPMQRQARYRAADRREPVLLGAALLGARCAGLHRPQTGNAKAQQARQDMRARLWNAQQLHDRRYHALLHPSGKYKIAAGFLIMDWPRHALRVTRLDHAFTLFIKCAGFH